MDKIEIKFLEELEESSSRTSREDLLVKLYQQSKSKDLEILELKKAIEIHEEGYLILDKEYEKLKSTIKNK